MTVENLLVETNSRRNPKQSYANLRKDRKSTDNKITVQYNARLENQSSTKTVRREINKTKFHGWAAIRKLLSKTKTAKGSEWSKNIQNWFGS